MEEKLERLAVELFNIDAVKFGDIEAKIGRHTPIYIDLRAVVSHPSVLVSIADQLQNLADGIQHDFLCGVPYTALPIATAISVRNNTPMVTRRKEAKLYGTKKKIEGTFSKGQKCLIIEDVVTSGGSVMETVEDLRCEGAVVTHALVVLDREQGGATVLETNGVKMKSLFKLTKLVGILVESGKISEDTMDSVLRHIAERQFNDCSKDNY